MVSAKTREQLESLALGLPSNPDTGIFGASIEADDAQLLLIPTPFDLTTSYGKGTMHGPEAIRRASAQLDLVDIRWGAVYRAGIGILPEDPKIKALSTDLADDAALVIEAVENDLDFDDKTAAALQRVNAATHEVCDRVAAEARRWLAKGKALGLVGGDHSCPLGLIKALAEHHSETGFGILHFDAHHDLRVAYEGFQHSHASIMYNVLQEVPAVKKLVSVGIRDYSSQEREFAAQHPAIHTFYDADIFHAQAYGETFVSITRRILAQLPEKVYVSFDIDGLEPSNCPSTGTPVAGGLSFQQAIFILEHLVESGKKVIGFDLNEVAPGEKGEWDGNVGARILYKLCGSLIRTQGLADLLS